MMQSRTLDIQFRQRGRVSWGSIFEKIDHVLVRLNLTITQLLRFRKRYDIRVFSAESIVTSNEFIKNRPNARQLKQNVETHKHRNRSVQCT